MNYYKPKFQYSYLVNEVWHIKFIKIEKYCLFRDSTYIEIYFSEDWENENRDYQIFQMSAKNTENLENFYFHHILENFSDIAFVRLNFYPLAY